MKSRLLNFAAALLFISARSPQSVASILNSSKEWLDAPEAIFAKELNNAGLVPTQKPESEPEPYRDPKEKTLEAELSDLTVALSAAGKTNSEAIVEQYKHVREDIYACEDKSQDHPPESEKTPDPFASLQQLGALDLPEEFLLYLKGAAHWRLNNKGAAATCWNNLLELPIAERHYRSTWAAYMLARHYVNSSPGRAHEMLDTLRRLAGAGFADTLNLANDSMGWEAAAYLKEGKYVNAIKLYCREGDINSLRITATQALEHASPDQLRDLATNEVSRKVVTSCLISGGLKKIAVTSESNEESSSTLVLPSVRLEKWSDALANAEIKDSWIAERLALAAYQASDYELTQQWIDAAPALLTCQWLQAKLRLQNDQIDDAAQALRNLTRSVSPNEDSSDLISALTVENEFGHRVHADKMVFAELGAVELNRQNFIPALDAFLKAEYWTDAAFVAERVLSIEELKSYTDSHCRGSSEGEGKLRWLLARRLMRLNQIREARAYFPSDLQPSFSQFTAALQTGFDQSESYETRAENFVEAARITRNKGLELFGTELEPDWRIHEGTSEFGLTSEIRLNTAEDALPPSEAEVERIKASAMPFSKRFHYRYVAAELAWIATLLMPNNSDETARVLCESGSWVKNIDAAYADRFYKSLVRRNRATELGDKADKMRWFPSLSDPPSVAKATPDAE